MEYGSAAWATAAKSNTSRLTKIQNAGMRLITGGMKSTPIDALEATTKLQSLDQRREEKVLTQHEKIQRLPQHPVHNIIQEHCKSRLKRQSFIRLSKQISRSHSDILPSVPEEREMLQDTEVLNLQQTEPTYKIDVPGVTSKDQPDHQLKSLTLEMLQNNKKNGQESTQMVLQKVQPKMAATESSSTTQTEEKQQSHSQ